MALSAPKVRKAAPAEVLSRRPLKKRLRDQRWLFAMLIPGIVWMIIFCYVPMYGIAMAFQDYNILDGVLGSSFVGLENFKILFSDSTFIQSLKTTLLISFLKLISGFPAPILFALFVNEIISTKFKKFVQSATYLPTFLSWVFVVGFTYTFLDVNGPVNNILVAMGVLKEPYLFMADPNWFLVVVIVQELWKGFGWGSIIYLANMASLDPQLYESALMDGCGRFKRMWYITLPMIKPTIAILFIMNVAGILGSNFDQMYTMGNGFVTDVSNVLSVYSYDKGITNGQFSLGTAMGLFGSVVSILMLVVANYSTKKLTGESYF